MLECYMPVIEAYKFLTLYYTVNPVRKEGYIVLNSDIAQITLMINTLEYVRTI